MNINISDVNIQITGNVYFNPKDNPDMYAESGSVTVERGDKDIVIRGKVSGRIRGASGNLTKFTVLDGGEGFEIHNDGGLDEINCGDSVVVTARVKISPEGYRLYLSRLVKEDA